MTRLYPDANGHVDIVPGTYWQDSAGAWWVCTPSGYAGILSAHDVVEHDDGTISVTPSILTPFGPVKSDGVTPNPRYWHGYLTNGEWTTT
jgi:hypothetical protein